MKTIEIDLEKVIIRGVYSFGRTAHVDMDSPGGAKTTVHIKDHATLCALGANIDRLAKVKVIIEIEPGKDQ